MAAITRDAAHPRALALIMAALLLLTACGGDDSDDEGVDTDDTVDEIIDGDPDADSEPETEGEEAEAIELDVEPITVGAFVITFTELEIVPDKFNDEIYTVNLSFTAENEVDDVLTPLSIGLDAIVLEGGDGFLTDAQVDAQPVPGGRTGKGTLSFSGTRDVDASDIPSSTLVFGTADQNQPSVTLDGSAAEPFSTMPVDLAVDDVSGVTRFQIDGASVVFRDANGRLLAEGGAVLTMTMVTSATDQTGGAGDYVGTDRVTLERPDGTSVAPDYLNRAVYPGDVLTEPLEFKLQAPIEGDYTMSFGEDITVAFTIG